MHVDVLPHSRDEITPPGSGKNLSPPLQWSEVSQKEAIYLLLEEARVAEETA
ncbi:MAG: hypothetical protein WCJ35_16290 [Planctomycetota bacterium]